MKLEFSRQVVEKYSSVKFHENPPRGGGGASCSTRADTTKLIVQFRNFASAPQNYVRCLAGLCVFIWTFLPRHGSHISPQPTLTEASIQYPSDRGQNGRTGGVNVLCVRTVLVVRHYELSRASCYRDWCQEEPAEQVLTPGQVRFRTESKARFNPLQPSGHYMYRQFNIQQFYVLPTQCIYVFCVDLRTNSDYFPMQH